jgi:hypothetical protein
MELEFCFFSECVPVSKVRGMYDTWISGSDVNSFSCYGVWYYTFWIPGGPIEVHLRFTCTPSASYRPTVSSPANPPPAAPPPLSSRRCLPAPHPCRFAIPIIGSNGTVDYVAAAAILASHVQGAVGALMPCFPRATVAFGAP